VSEPTPQIPDAGGATSARDATGSHRRDRRADGREALEDYAKAIYGLASGDEAVSTSAIAERLGVSPGTVTAMVKRLAKLGLADHEPYRGVALTDSGERIALEVIRHHRLIETYLSDALGMSWDRVHDEAEVLEHYISEELEELMAQALGQPTRDPHGDPIPDRALELASEARGRTSLVDMPKGQSGTFERVSDRDPEMLRYLDEREVRPGSRLEVIAHEPFGGSVRIKVGGCEHGIGAALAARMLVDVA
jgi:DtxR family Mn-dependent transcriptional regulator